ncbi:MAG: SRPBCC domain-containing protein [Ignavibacteriales bacterium]|nr:SRPBCC domain-containing protein [Ignavibacteriales bacterium]
MNKLKFSITINASKARVWDTMLNDATYRIWTEAFAPGCYYVGDWSEGSKILFLASRETGDSGMVSRIKANRLHEYISIEHLGMVENGKEDYTSNAVKEWAGVLENYTFKDVNGITELFIEMDSNEEYSDMFNDMWPKALTKLKELSEK